MLSLNLRPFFKPSLFNDKIITVDFTSNVKKSIISSKDRNRAAARPQVGLCIGYSLHLHHTVCIFC